MRKLCCAVGVGLVMLIVARAVLKQHEAAGDPTAPVETSVTAGSQIDRVDDCIDSQACIDSYLWSLYERTRKVDTVRVPGARRRRPHARHHCRLSRQLPADHRDRPEGFERPLVSWRQLPWRLWARAGR